MSASKEVPKIVIALPCRQCNLGVHEKDGNWIQRHNWKAIREISRNQCSCATKGEHEMVVSMRLRKPVATVLLQRQPTAHVELRMLTGGGQTHQYPQTWPFSHEGAQCLAGDEETVHGDEETVHEPERQEILFMGWAWNYDLQTVGEIRELFFGHGEVPEGQIVGQN